MKIKQIIDEMEKEFDVVVKGIDEDECSQPSGWWETSSGAEFGTKKKAEIKSFIHSYTRKLIESVAEEILGEDDEKEVFWKEGCHDVEVECDNSSRNLLRAEQRLKVKEIITNLK